MKSASTIALAAALLLASVAGHAQTTGPAVYIHAGALLDRPGQAPRGASTIIVRNGRVESVRDGLVAPGAASARASAVTSPLDYGLPFAGPTG